MSETDKAIVPRRSARKPDKIIGLERGAMWDVVAFLAQPRFIGVFYHHTNPGTGEPFVIHEVIDTSIIKHPQDNPDVVESK